MVIDGHGHACGGYLSSDLITKHLDNNKVDYVVLVPGQSGSTKTYQFKEKQYKDGKETLDNTNKLIRIVTSITRSKKHIPLGNRQVYELKNINNRVLQYYWAINSFGINQIEKDYNEMKFNGIKLHQCWERNDLYGKWIMDLLAWTSEKAIPIFIHLYSRDEITKIMELAKSKPKIIFIIAHCYGIDQFSQMSGNALSNIYFDISNNYFVPMEKIKNNFPKLGSTKFLLGSDTPYGENALKLTIERIQKMDIATIEKENILGTNLKNILRI